MKHTPGPWVLDDTNENHIQRGKGGKRVFKVVRDVPYGGLIADVSWWWVDARTAKENARLIAASPDLLEAAKNAANVLAAFATGQLKEITSDSAALKQLRTAIAKAEGRE